TTSDHGTRRVRRGRTRPTTCPARLVKKGCSTTLRDHAARAGLVDAVLLAHLCEQGLRSNPWVPRSSGRAGVSIGSPSGPAEGRREAVPLTPTPGGATQRGYEELRIAARERRANPRDVRSAPGAHRRDAEDAFGDQAGNGGVRLHGGAPG